MTKATDTFPIKKQTLLISFIICVVALFLAFCCTDGLKHFDLMLREMPLGIATFSIGGVYIVSHIVLTASLISRVKTSFTNRMDRIVTYIVVVLLNTFFDILLGFGVFGYLFSLGSETGKTIEHNGQELVEVDEGFLDPTILYYPTYGPFLRSTQSVEVIEESPTEVYDPPSTKNDIPNAPEPSVPETLEPENTTPTGEPYYSVFITPELGFRMFSSASSSTLQKTMDAGSTWYNVNFPVTGKEDACRFILDISKDENENLVAQVGYPSWVTKKDPSSHETVMSISYDEGETWSKLESD